MKHKSLQLPDGVSILRPMQWLAPESPGSVWQLCIEAWPQIGGWGIYAERDEPVRVQDARGNVYMPPTDPE